MVTVQELTIEIIQKCVNKCKFCSSESDVYSENILSFGDIQKIISEGQSVKNVYVSGGEPLLHPGIRNILTFLCNDQKFNVSLYTSGITYDNGVAISNDWAKYSDLKNKLKLVFNIQSCHPPIHDDLCVNKGSFWLTRSSIICAKKTGFCTEVHVVPNKQNFNTLVDTVCFLDGIGVDQINILRLVVQGRALKFEDELVMNNEEKIMLKEIFEKIRNLKLNVQVRFGIPFTSDSKCTAGYKKLLVRYDGKVFPCEAFKNDERFVVGNIDESDYFNRAVKRVERHALLNTLRDQVGEKESCSAQILIL